jgi:hypothetical protein
MKVVGVLDVSGKPEGIPPEFAMPACWIAARRPRLYDLLSNLYQLELRNPASAAEAQDDGGRLKQ